MSKRDKGLLVFLLIVVLIAFFYFFVYQRISKNIISLEEQIVVQKEQLLLYDNSVNNISKMTEQKEALINVLKQDFDGYLGKIEQEEIILLLNEILLRSNVEVSSINFSEKEGSDLPSLNYDTIDINISITGEYNDTVNFMSSFWRFDQNIYIPSMSMTNSDGNLSSNLIVSFIRMNNEFTEMADLFEWYEDVYYDKENPFSQKDFSYLFNPNYFYTGTDVAFYNEPFEGFEDISDHWAEEVINFFGRNGYLVADEFGNIRPDEPMTRLETVLLLDLVFRWELQENFIELESFADYDVITDLSDIEKKSLLKAYNSGYIFGYEDNTLRPYSNITYEELGYLGDNLINNVNVTWADVAEEINTLFAYQSVGVDEPNLPATRAEIIYFLSYINDGLLD